MFVYKLGSQFKKIRLKIPAVIVLKIKRMGKHSQISWQCDRGMSANSDINVKTEKLWHEADKLKRP